MGEMTQRMIEAAGAELCVEGLGDAADAPVLLIAGTGSSMVWWEDGFCRLLTDGGRFVIRYDHRDTGRSSTYEPGHPGYTGADLVADAAAVLDGFEIAAAHVVGVSAGAGLAQVLAVERAERVRSLVLTSTSSAFPLNRWLPHPTAEFTSFLATAEVDWSDPSSVEDYMVAYLRVLAGGTRRFDEPAARALIRRDMKRARNYAAVRNHDIIAGEPMRGSLADISAPTLVVHGTADPMFPPAHGEALADEIPSATLLLLDGAGHGVERADWEALSRAILEHTR
jgi:pimeloyl-ACP methyl ester carboxylesterase